jgi:translation initiation factor 5A
MADMNAGVADEKVSASLLVPATAHDLKKGSIGILKGQPCKIMDVKTSKTGKHGHAKCNITGICAISGKKYNEVHPAHKGVMMVNIQKQDLSFSHFDGDEAVCMNSDCTAEVSVDYTEEQKAEIEKIQADCADDEEVVVTAISAPTYHDEKEKVHTVIDKVAKQKMA